ncbi:MAG: hypothetical protein IKH88_17245 [Prevotella sp.]|nr:hypothetical protein [Prevotella sp.]
MKKMLRLLQQPHHFPTNLSHIAECLAEGKRLLIIIGVRLIFLNNIQIKVEFLAWNSTLFVIFVSATKLQ